MKILVVDDNKLLADCIKVILEGEDYEVRSANDGTEGYLEYLAFEPDLIITDLQMPSQSGIELMRHIRAHDPRAKAIYMSADLEEFRPLLEEEKVKYRVSLLSKPFSMAELTSLLSQLQYPTNLHNGEEINA